MPDSCTLCRVASLMGCTCYAVAWNHRGAYSHSLTQAPDGGPAISSNVQDRRTHLAALVEGAQAGLQQAGAQCGLQVDLQQPQARVRAMRPSLTAPAHCCCWWRPEFWPSRAGWGCTAGVLLSGGLCLQMVLAVEVLVLGPTALCALALLEAHLFPLPRLLIRTLQPHQGAGS